jgi:transposase
VIFGAVPPRIYIATQPVDFHKGLDGLAAVAKEVLKLDPFSGAPSFSGPNVRIG